MTDSTQNVVLHIDAEDAAAQIEGLAEAFAVPDANYQMASAIRATVELADGVYTDSIREKLLGHLDALFALQYEMIERQYAAEIRGYIEVDGGLTVSAPDTGSDAVVSAVADAAERVDAALHSLKNRNHGGIEITVAGDKAHIKVAPSTVSYEQEFRRLFHEIMAGGSNGGGVQWS